MYFKSKAVSLSILGATSVVCSRALFFFFEDPEGPNLLVVTVMALLIYGASLALYFSRLPTKGLKRLLSVILAQVVLVVALYFCLR